VLPSSFDFRIRRTRQPELMDQPGLDHSEHLKALRGLRRINALSRTSAVLWPQIARLITGRESQDRPVRVLDLATGGGDAPIALARRAIHAGANIVVDGCDLNPQAVHHAQFQANARGARVRFFVLDALHEELPSGYDVVSCSLFLHHLDEADAIALLRRMAASARSLVLVDDLIRSWRGYLLAAVGCRLLSGSRIVHIDGPASVIAAFTPGEALSLAERAGLGGARVKRHWPQRYLLSWSAE
jgi:2-polyprenyl-3-methyl-5-hydroxy-6-metoxy-1,4-benzoquinol methylase